MPGLYSFPQYLVFKYYRMLKKKILKLFILGSTRYYSDKDLYVGDFTFISDVGPIKVASSVRNVAYITLDCDAKKLLFTYNNVVKQIA